MKNYTYKFSIWLFDKDSKTQKISTRKASKIVESQTIKYFGYGTIWNTIWIYTHDNWELVREPSISVSVSFNEKPLQNLVSEYVNVLKSELNQESIMLQVSEENLNFL